MSVRLRAAEDDYRKRYQEEGEERSDIGEIGERTDIEDARWNADGDACYAGGDVRRAEFAVDTRESGRGSRPSRDIENQMRA